jgi:signal transduction histidine kinase
MASRTEIRWIQLQRAGWMLWAAAFALLIALATVVPALYARVLGLTEPGEMPPGLQNPYVVTVALAGLVILFCLYTAIQQRELLRAVRALTREESDRVDASVRLSELTALFQVSTTLQLQLRSDVILEIIVRRVVSTLKAQQASIMILEPDTGELVTRASYGLESEFSRGARKRIGEGIAGWVALRREAVSLGEEAPKNDLGRHYKENRRITSALSLPLAVGERVIGVLNVNRINHTEPFGDHHLEVLRVFAEHIAAVIDRAEVMDHMGRRTRELEADNEKLADLNRMKDIFLGTASHELKTPLTSVIAYAELLDDHDGKLSREQAREFVGRLRAEAQRLLSLIEDILDLSRLESGKLALKPRTLEIAEVAKGAIETTQPLAQRYGVTLESDLGEGLPPITVDEVKIRQVLVNLLVNAVKFSPRGAPVRLRTVLDDNCIRVEVHDRGPGIAPDTATHIFELFGQVVPEDAESRGGLGIGLHLVKRITEMHGGHVGVNSRPGEGSAFWIRLPIAPQAFATGEAVREAKAGADAKADAEAKEAA